MADNETIADIIAEMRKYATDYYGRAIENGGEKGNPGMFYLDMAQFAKVNADRLEAACKRKLSNFNPKCDWSVQEAFGFANTLANHGWTREANNDAASSCIYSLCRLLKERGNAAKLREALKHIKDRLPHMLQYMRVHWEDASAGGYFDELMLVINAALSAPPRNCDRPECATTKAAADVWRKEDGGKTAYHDWLLALSTEQEGGSDAD